MDLGGRDAAPALVGSAFLARWGNRTVEELFRRIRTSMPQNDPGSLDTQTYLDIEAFLLRFNNFASGNQRLTESSQMLKRGLLIQ